MRLADLVRRVLGPEIPLGVRTYDGSESVPPGTIAAMAGKSPATITPAVVASAPREITAMNQSAAGLSRRDTGINAASTRAKLLLAAERPEISGECFSTRAVIIDSIGSAVHQGVGHCS